MSSYLVRFADYRGMATEVAERLSRSRPSPWTAAAEVVVASGGMAESIRKELIRRSLRGIAGVRLATMEALARRVLNLAGEYPRVADDAERRLAMRAATRSIDAEMMESRGIGSMI